MKKLKNKGILITLIIMAILYGITFFYTPAENTFSFCPSKMFFGIRCPLCGSGRAFVHFSKGEFLEVSRTNKSVFLFYPIYLFAMYLCLAVFLRSNNLISLPGLKLINFINRYSIIIVIVLFLLALSFLIYDLIVGSGENFFDYDYTIYSKVFK
jgi:hypothetical protein